MQPSLHIFSHLKAEQNTLISKQKFGIVNEILMKLLIVVPECGVLAVVRVDGEAEEDERDAHEEGGDAEEAAPGEVPDGRDVQERSEEPDRA